VDGATGFFRYCAQCVNAMQRAFRHGAVGSASDIWAQVRPRRGLVDEWMLLQTPLHFAGVNQPQVVKAGFLRGRRRGCFWFRGVEFPKDSESSHRQKHQNECRFLRHELPKAVPAILSFVNVAGI